MDYAEVSMIATTSTSENERSRTSAIFDLDSDEESEVLKLFAECEISQFCISDSDILESFAIQTTQSDIAVSTVVGDEGASRMLAASVAPEGYRGPSVAMCSKRPGGSCKRSGTEIRYPPIKHH